MKLKRFESLRFTDDFIFCKVLENNTDLTKELLEIILGFPISEVRNTESQKSLRFTPADRGVRFDVYVEDEHSVVCISIL